MATGAILKSLLPLIVPLALKTVLFIFIFRWRKQRVSFLTSFLLGGAPLILTVVPLPLPPALAAVAAVGVALYLLSQYTEVKLVPDGIVIIVVVEAVSRLVLSVAV